MRYDSAETHGLPTEETINFTVHGRPASVVVRSGACPPPPRLAPGLCTLLHQPLSSAVCVRHTRAAACTNSVVRCALAGANKYWLSSQKDYTYTLIIDGAQLEQERFGNKAGCFGEVRRLKDPLAYAAHCAPAGTRALQHWRVVCGEKRAMS